MNTQIKHTPGPWHIGMKPGPMVYGPQGEQVVGINVMLDIEEVTANAHLIAAAPAMYHELKESLVLLRASYHDMCAEHGVDSMHAQIVFDRIESVQTALAQAEAK